MVNRKIICRSLYKELQKKQEKEEGHHERGDQHQESY